MADIGGLGRSDIVRVTGSDELLAADVSLNLLKNRLHTESSVDPRPSQFVIYKNEFLLNAGSLSMTVNGSVTPVNFDFTPASGETWFITNLSIHFSDGNTPDPNDFGDSAGLTNGIDIKARTNGTEYTIGNCKTNSCIALAFNQHTFSIDAAAFLNASDVWLGSMNFEIPITLQNSTSDYFRVTIRDNLTAIDYLRMRIKGYRVV